MTAENQENDWQDLAQKAQSGDQAAYQNLLTQIYPVIKKFLISKVGPGHNHEDITQECLIAVHKALHTYDPKRPFKPWLFTVVRYRLIDNLRKIQKQMAREVLNPEILATSPDSDTYHEVEDTEEMIKKALDSLPSDMRRALVLTKIEGLSTQEASQKEGITPVALRSRVSRAYKTLRKKLEKEIARP
ncbi:MAG: RNA polymerase sigma factor [Pseudomonadota bacterium]